jgi:peptidyl-prolyl cis-trans isomerase SurA
MKARPDLNTTMLRTEPFSAALEKISEALAFIAKADLLAKSSPEFNSLLKDYNDGIMLYEVEQDRVWKRISPNDSLLRIYFSQNREKFTFPERLNLLVATTSWQPDAEAVHAQVQLGKTLREIYVADSTQASRPTHFSASFARNSIKLSAAARKTLVAVGAELRADTTLRVAITAWPDTTAQKARNEAVARKRLEAVRTMLSKKLSVPDQRISRASMPQGPRTTSDSLARIRAAANTRLDIDIVGRRMKMIIPPATVLLARDADERAKRADSLAPGAYTTPFSFKGQNLVAQLVRREAARQKTFEEAAPEVSTSFQDYEAKRLESVWIEGLKVDFPVVEHKEVLKNAFAPAR